MWSWRCASCMTLSGSTGIWNKGQMAFRNILIFCKKGHAGARELGSAMLAWLRERGLAPELVEARDHYDFPQLPDLAIALGGDGTILGIARFLAGTGRPILGVNFGRVGFLAALGADVWREGLEDALCGRLEDRPFLALAWELWRDGALAHSGVAINDVVVGRGCLARLTTLRLAIDGRERGEIRSDGLIVTSPLGSSGYSVSAGGPLLSPALEVVGLTPICPFMANPAPLVLPAGATVEIKVEAASNDCFLTLDGQIGHALRRLDLVVARGMPHAVHFLARDASFPERLQARK